MRSLCILGSRIARRETLALELGECSVTVNRVAPGDPTDRVGSDQRLDVVVQLSGGVVDERCVHKAGATALTRIPFAAYSSAALRVRPMPGVLGRHVAGVAGNSGHSRVGPDVFDGADALLLHHFQLVLHGKERAAHVWKYPSAASAIAEARPVPVPPPVTNALFFPSKSVSVVRCLP